MLTAIQNARIFTGTEIVQNSTLLIRDQHIDSIIPDSSIPSGATMIDAKGGLLSPGFIDLQIYGGGGYLFSNDPTEAAVQAISDALVKEGTTTYLLTLATNETAIYLRAFEAAKNNPHPALAGLHLEGPFFNPVKRGAHIEKLIRQPTIEEVEAWLQAAGGTLKMMTLAPEVCSDEVLRLLQQHDVLLSAGHSNASFAEAMHGFSKGIRAVTHLFNAMSALHHRDTGLPGAAFLSNAAASIIADGIHVDWPTLRISKQLMGKRLFLITDAVQENLSGAYVHLRKPDRYTLPDGTLSGSCLTMADAVRNCVQHAGIGLTEALRMATLYPAELMQWPELGRIAPGAKANLVLLDHEMKVQTVFLAGRAQGV